MRSGRKYFFFLIQKKHHRRFKENINVSSLVTATFFFRITQYIGDTHNARTLIPMNTRTQTLPLGASSKTVPANPQD
jgi:hypothetical protein